MAINDKIILILLFCAFAFVQTATIAHNDQEAKDDKMLVPSSRVVIGGDKDCSMPRMEMKFTTTRESRRGIAGYIRWAYAWSGGYHSHRHTGFIIAFRDAMAASTNLATCVEDMMTRTCESCEDPNCARDSFETCSGSMWVTTEEGKGPGKSG